jgi:transcription initiation factor TFIIIB Brf1 subunit/transcription initiation factor TFIIB
MPPLPPTWLPAWYAESAAQRPDICNDCGSDEMVHTPCEIVCGACGLVKVMGCVQDRAEWRTFAQQEDGPEPDRSRVGAPGRDDGRDDDGSTLGTAMGGPPRGRLQTLQARQQAEAYRRTPAGRRHRTLAFVRQVTAHVCQALELPRPVERSAVAMAEDYLAIADAPAVRGDPAGRALASACVFFACFELTGGTRLVEEIHAVAAPSADAPTDALHRALLHTYQQLLRAYPSRYAEVLRLPQRDTDADCIKRLVARLPQITSDAQMHRVTRKAFQLREALAHDPRIAYTTPKVLNTVFVYLACHVCGLGADLTHASMGRLMEVCPSSIGAKLALIHARFREEPLLAARLLAPSRAL